MLGDLVKFELQLRTWMKKVRLLYLSASIRGPCYLPVNKPLDMEWGSQEVPRMSEHDISRPKWYNHNKAPILSGNIVVVVMGAEDYKSQTTKMPTASVFYTGQGNCTHKMSTIWSIKQDLYDDNFSWYANMNVEISQSPISHIKDQRWLMMLKKGRGALSKNQLPDGLLNPKQSALNMCTDQ